MAYKAENEERIELANVAKNSRGDFVIASKITNKATGSVSIDIRQFYTNDKDEVCPSSKGVRFNAEVLLDLLTGLVEGLEVDEMDTLAERLGALADGYGEDEIDDSDGDD